MMTSLLAVVNAHTETIRTGTVSCIHEACPRCQAKAPEFKRHDCRERILLLVISALVRKVVILLIRWKCPCCGKIFTDYPDFILPFKRYAQPLVMLCANRYLDDDQATYRQATRVEGRPLFHAAETPGALDSRELAPSTIHRWVSWLGGLPGTLRAALCLIRARTPDLDLHRRHFPVPPRKYRSEARRLLLQVSRQFCLVVRVYREILGLPLFPRFAISCGWT